MAQGPDRLLGGERSVAFCRCCARRSERRLKLPIAPSVEESQFQSANAALGGGSTVAECNSHPPWREQICKMQLSSSVEGANLQNATLVLRGGSKFAKCNSRPPWREQICKMQLSSSVEGANLQNATLVLRGGRSATIRVAPQMVTIRVAPKKGSDDSGGTEESGTAPQKAALCFPGARRFGQQSTCCGMVGFFFGALRLVLAQDAPHRGTCFDDDGEKDGAKRPSSQSCYVRRYFAIGKAVSPGRDSDLTSCGTGSLRRSAGSAYPGAQSGPARSVGGPAQLGTCGRAGGKHPGGNSTVSSPARSRAAASR